MLRGYIISMMDMVMCNAIVIIERGERIPGFPYATYTIERRNLQP